MRGRITLTQDGESTYHGDATSIVGALNELLTLIGALTGQLNGLIGITQPAKSPLTFEIVPDQIGYPLHFKFVLSEDDQFSVVAVTRESATNTVGWFYEEQLPPPPLPPTPPRPPGSLPGAILVPLPAPIPTWKPLPLNGLDKNKQVHPDGRPVRVQYRPQPGDPIYARRHYRVVVQEKNIDYGEAELASIVFG